MSDESGRKAYRTDSITVTFEARRCLHAAECVRGLPEVFDVAKRPWIQPEKATAERLAEVVRLCPSGALQYELVEGGTEVPARPTTITRGATGQLTVRGELSVETPEGARAETRAVLCGCGESRLQPYCDHAGPCGR
ncbi:(4Fe-4S)-binding protein [Streptomyces sp. NPDC004959]|uniref:(4Fe-4S)-binding protein n=1 Tax=unclassified Streptomyces TaxID=2593676 RepID=UPI0004C9C9E0|nr:(4Fe-4S)-binding protein [Streptomyces sp. NRRL F-5630]